MTTLTYCLRIERTDGVIYRFTSHDRELEMSNGTVYVPDQGGADVTAVTAGSDGRAATFDLDGALTPNGIRREEIAAGLFDHAQLYLFRTLWDDAVEDDEPLGKGFWGEAEMQDHRYTVEFRSLSHLLEQRVGRVHTALCDADLGDSRCKVVLANFTDSGTVQSVTDRKTFTAALGRPDDFFGAGLVTFTSGENAGISREVDTYEADQFVMWQAFPFVITAGDTFDAQAGCRKRFQEDCIAKFDNAVNHQAFPHLPGRDAINRFGGQ